MAPTMAMEMEGDKFHLLPSQTLTDRSHKKLNSYGRRHVDVVGAINGEQDSSISSSSSSSTVDAIASNGGEIMKNKFIPSSSSPNKDYNLGNYSYSYNYDYDCNAGFFENASFMRWKAVDVLSLIRCHPIPCIFAASLLFFMGVEYTLRMVPSSSPPFDLGFVVTLPLHRMLASRPNLNSFLAGLNTMFVAMQTVYILWTWLIEGRPRATISALFMFTCRGILGYLTQLPVPEDFLGSGVDFPVGNVSFFLFYSGHVAASVIASMDMKRMQRWELSWTFDTLNALQVVRLLSTRGHYTIDLIVGIGAGILFDALAGNYLESKTKGIEIAIETMSGTTALPPTTQGVELYNPTTTTTNAVATAYL